jgi:hypothetical protein
MADGRAEAIRGRRTGKRFTVEEDAASGSPKTVMKE